MIVKINHVSIHPIIWENFDVKIKKITAKRYFKCDCGANLFIPSAYNAGSDTKIYKCVGCGRIIVSWD